MKEKKREKKGSRPKKGGMWRERGGAGEERREIKEEEQTRKSRRLASYRQICRWLPATLLCCVMALLGLCCGSVVAVLGLMEPS